MILAFALLIAAPDVEDPAWWMRETLNLSGKPAAQWQPLLAALDAFQPQAQKSSVKALYQTLSRFSAASPDVALSVRCLSALGLVRAGAPLQTAGDCSNDDTGVLFMLEAVAQGAGGNARGAAIAQAAKSESARVRAFAARAGVFALSDPKAAAVVKQALRTGDAVTVALVAEAFVLASEPLPAPKRPRAWISELVNAAEREEVDDEAMRALRDAVAAIDPAKAEDIEVAPASQPVAKMPPRSVTTDVASIRYIIDRDGRVVPVKPGTLVALGATRQSPR